MSGFTRELLRDIHQIVNEATRPLSPEMKKKIEELADELGNVPRTTILRALTNMANQGDSLDDLEGVKQELSQMH